MNIFLFTLYLSACSAKKYDNSLVETAIFFHFRDLILCNVKHLQYYLIKKNKNIGAHFSKSYILLLHPFFKFMELLIPFALHKSFSHCNRSIFIFDGCWLKLLLFRQISLCLIVFNFKKSGAPIINI